MVNTQYKVKAFVRGSVKILSALSPLAFTSNDPPPQNDAYRRRFLAMQYNDGEKWTEAEEKFKSG